ADPDGRVRGRGPDGRAARLLRPPRRLDQCAAAGHHLKPPARPLPDLRLAGGDVLLHDGAWRLVRADVTVREGRIEAIGKAGKRDEGGGKGPRPEAQVRDCSGCLVIPGLIQAHVHLCQTLFRGLADDLRLEDWLIRRIWPLPAAPVPCSGRRATWRSASTPSCTPTRRKRSWSAKRCCAPRAWRRSLTWTRSASRAAAPRSLTASGLTPTRWIAWRVREPRWCT